jgi:membrane protein DedA with SNARE-associated domain
MHMTAAASPGTAYGAWAYLVIFALMAISFVGVPAIGTCVIGWAAVLASENHLSFAIVLIAAAVGAEAGGLAGYYIGDRWARALLERPGRGQERRQKIVGTAEKIYAKWGRLAVFFTSTIVSGVLRMKYSQFVIWNFVEGVVYVLSIGLAAYGAGKVAAGERDWGSLGPMVIGLAVATGSALVAVRYYRRRKASRQESGANQSRRGE